MDEPQISNAMDVNDQEKSNFDDIMDDASVSTADNQGETMEVDQSESFPSTSNIQSYSEPAEESKEPEDISNQSESQEAGAEEEEENSTLQADQTLDQSNFDDTFQSKQSESYDYTEKSINISQIDTDQNNESNDAFDALKLSESNVLEQSKNDDDNDQDETVAETEDNDQQQQEEQKDQQEVDQDSNQQEEENIPSRTEQQEEVENVDDDDDDSSRDQQGDTTDLPEEGSKDEDVPMETDQQAAETEKSEDQSDQTEDQSNQTENQSDQTEDQQEQMDSESQTAEVSTEIGSEEPGDDTFSTPTAEEPSAEKTDEVEVEGKLKFF